MKVLLVDDEIFTIRMLQNLIHWSELGLELIGYAQDGQEALEKILKEMPDIVISDIRMPGMSGLELLKKLNDMELGIKTVLVSAYADFAYVKEAMKLGGCDYILKPIDESELEQALRKVVMDIHGEKEQERIVNNSARQLDKINLYQFMRTNHGLNKILKSCQKFDTDMQRFSLFMVQPASGTIDEYNNSNNMEMIEGGYITKILEGMLAVYQVNYSIFDYEDGIWTILLDEVSGLTREEIARGLIDKLEEADIHVNVCFSSYGKELKDMPVLYQESKNLFKYSFYIGEEAILGYGYNCNQREMDEIRNIGMIKDIEKAVLDKDTGRVIVILNEAFELNSLYYPRDKKGIYDLCYQTLQHIRQNVSEERRTDKVYQEVCNITYEKLAELQTVKELKKTMVDIIEKISELQERPSGRSYSKAVEEGMALIEARYNQNLSLEEICLEIAISKNYFCYLFKRETGMSIWNYLTVIRLQHAKKLLEKTELKSYEIAFQVGYDNPSYFSKLFKKYELMTPNEYRESKK